MRLYLAALSYIHYTVCMHFHCLLFKCVEHGTNRCQVVFHHLSPYVEPRAVCYVWNMSITPHSTSLVFHCKCKAMLFGFIYLFCQENFNSSLYSSPNYRMPFSSSNCKAAGPKCSMPNIIEMLLHCTSTVWVQGHIFSFFI